MMFTKYEESVFFHKEYDLIEKFLTAPRVEPTFLPFLSWLRQIIMAWTSFSFSTLIKPKSLLQADDQ